MSHPNPTVVLIPSTKEVRSISPDSYAAQFACGEAISLDPHGREPEAEVYCDDCAGFRVIGFARSGRNGDIVAKTTQHDVVARVLAVLGGLVGLTQLDR